MRSLLFGSIFLMLLTPQIRAADKVVILAEDDWYPYSAIRNGKAEGFAVDIVREAYKAVNVEATMKAMPYARCMVEVRENRAIGCFDTVKQATNLKDFNFGVQPLFDANIVIYGNAAEKASNVKVADLDGQVVGVTNGYTYGDEFEKNTKIKREAARGDLLNLKKLAEGRIRYFVAYESVVKYLVGANKSDFDGKVKKVGFIQADKLFVNFSKKHVESKKFLELLDKGLTKIRADGTYHKIEEMWNAKLMEGS